MTPQVDTVVGINLGYSNPRNLSVTVASNSNRLLLVLFTHDSGTVTSVTYGGTGMTAYGLVGAWRLYYLIDPPTGTANVTVTLSGGAAGRITAYSLFDADQASPVRAVATSYDGGTGTPISASVTSVVDDLVIDALATAGTTPTADGGQTRQDYGADFMNASSTKTATTTSTTMGWNAQAASIKNLTIWSIIGATVVASGPVTIGTPIRPAFFKPGLSK